ncbi:MAG: protein kinase [Deltaproteobacteria bacterium]|nr:protein kinase [Deltaproteobacteria bacterium]
MGVVYEAVDPRDESRVALKVLLPHAAEEQEGVLRFKREFRALARLRHPNIVRVFDAGIEEDVPFIVMEFLEGRDIRRHLRSIPEGPAREGELRRCLRQIFGALAHIHARRIVHRDLKPENIFVLGEGRVKLMDFGVALLAKAPDSHASLLGTFAYMAPEQMTTGEIDGRSDLYAIGVLMYEILTGGYPFPVEPPAAALHHHVHTIPEHVRHRNPKADVTLAGLTHRLMEKDPLDRLQSAEDAIRYLADGDALELPVARLPAQLFEPRCVGRAGEVAQLEQWAAEVADGRGAIVLIEGQSGIGKSRLVGELSKIIRKRMHVLRGVCASERTAAYGAIQPILDEIATIAGRSSPDVVERIIGAEARLIHAISPKLGRMAGAAQVDQSNPAERRLRLHKAVVGVIGRLALSRPLMLVVEDLHWADSSTLELLWDAARALLGPRPRGDPGETVCPVLLVLTRRSLAEGPDASEQLVRRLQDRRRIERLVLGPLDRVGVGEMLRTMTGVPHPSPAAIEALYAATQGRPLLVQDTVQAWTSEGVLVRRDGGWFFRDAPLAAREQGADTIPPEQLDRAQVAGASAPLAATRTRATPSAGAMADGTEAASENERGFGVRTAMAADGARRMRLEHLDPAARALLEQLSLLGRLLPAELLSAVAGADESLFLDAIDELVRAGLLIEDVVPGGVQYRFYHEGFRDAVARGLTPEARERIHFGIAVRLERTLRARRTEFSHILARHFIAGGAAGRAIRYLRKTAAAAAERGDIEAGMRRLSEAIELLDELPRTAASATRRLGVLLQQIDMLLDFGRLREALDRADPHAAHDARSPWTMSAELCLRRAAAQYALGNFEATLETLSWLDGRAPSRSIGARSLELEARAYVAQGDYAKARAMLEAGRDIAKSGGLTDLAEDLDAKIGVVLVHQGDNLAALGKLERGLERARTRSDTRMMAEILGFIGRVQVSRGNNTAAVACYREAIDLAEARGVRAELERWSGELGMLMSALGDVEGAQRQLELALELARDSGSRQGEAMWRGELGIHLLNAGRFEKAASELTRSLGIAREIGFTLYEGWALVYLAALALERDLSSFEGARANIDEALEVADVLGHPELRLMATIQLAKLCRAQGDIGSARAIAEEAERLAAAAPNLRRKARVAREMASLSLGGRA